MTCLPLSLLSWKLLGRYLAVLKPTYFISEVSQVEQTLLQWIWRYKLQRVVCQDYWILVLILIPVSVFFAVMAVNQAVITPQNVLIYSVRLCSAPQTLISMNWQREWLSHEVSYSLLCMLCSWWYSSTLLDNCICMATVWCLTCTWNSVDHRWMARCVFWLQYVVGGLAGLNLTIVYFLYIQNSFGVHWMWLW